MSGAALVEDVSLIDSSLFVSGFFGDISLSSACVVVAIVAVVVVTVAVVVIATVVVVSIGLMCFIVECDFALLVIFTLSSVPAVRC